MKTSSSGFDSFASVSAAAATRERLSFMLPLLSTRMPIETGTSSRRNSLIGCSTLSSYTLNADRGRLVTSFPLLSRTLTCSATSLISVRKVGVSSCARSSTAAIPAVKRPAASHFLLCRCNISRTVPCPQRRKFLHLDQFHFHLSVLAV